MTKPVPLSRFTDRELIAILIERGKPARKMHEALHAQQRGVLDGGGRFVAVRAGRRSGKTVLNGSILAANLERCGFDEVCVYVARTREIARRLIWGKLKELQRAHGFDWTLREDTLEVRNARGGYIAIVGADKIQEIEKLRGLKMRVAILDEPATYSHVIEPLVRDVIEPALGDLRGRLYATGTPGVVCSGWWFEVSTGARKKWHVYHWTVRENPHFPQPDEYLLELLEENGWTETHPTYVREQLAEWVHNPDDLVYRVKPANIVEALPEDYDRAQWRHVLAIDYGVTDSTAWCVLAWNPRPPVAPKRRREVYVIAAEKRAGLAPSAVADITKAYWDTYQPEVCVGDSGGLGKAMIAEMNTRYPGCPIIAADKQEKRAHIEHLNGDLTSGNVLFVRASTSALLAEAAVLPWKQEKLATAGGFTMREVADPAYEDHLCDAMLYGWRWTLAHTTTPEVRPPLPESPLDLVREQAPWDGWAPSDRADLFD